MPNDKDEQPPETASSELPRHKVFDLEERTAKFGEAAIIFAKRLPRNVVTLPLIRQFVRSSTSVGANYCEADDSVSRKEFRCKIGICRKEAKETKYWLRMISVATEDRRDDARNLWREAHEIYLILSKIFHRVSD
jgi:four helix bundle protein